MITVQKYKKVRSGKYANRNFFLPVNLRELGVCLFGYSELLPGKYVHIIQLYFTHLQYAV